MKKNFLAMVAVGLLAGPIAAHAVPITVSAGQSQLWNFDLTGATPPPPYPGGVFTPSLSGADFGDAGSWSLFSDLNGGGSEFFTAPLFLGFHVGADAGWTDGVFSARLTMTAGSILADPIFRGAKAPGLSTGPIAGTPVVAGVPEPGTLALFGLGLAALGLATRRRKANLFA